MIKKIMAVALLALTIAGCGKPNIEITTPNSKPQAANGRLTIASLQEPNLLNPLLAENEAAYEVDRLIYSGLLFCDDKGSWQADLALDVPSSQNGGISQDGRVLTYHLRPGVAWHDGVAFTADDVKFTWQMIMSKKLKISRDGYEQISGIDTPNPTTVIVRFKDPYPGYLSLFPFLMPKHLWEKEADWSKSPLNRAPIGTGPFKFVNWQLAEQIELEANSSYYRGKPRLNKINYKFVTDNDILLNQLKVGEVDIAVNLPFASADQGRAVVGSKSVLVPTGILEELAINLDLPQFQDANVRLAIDKSIDRPGIVSQVLKGVAHVATGDQPIGSWALRTDLKAGTRDISAAKELLAQSGWTQGPNGVWEKSGKKLAFSIQVPSGNKLREQVAFYLASQLRETGMQVEVQTVDEQLFFNERLPMRRFELALFALVTNEEPDNYDLWNSSQIPASKNGYGGRNYAGWRNQEVDQLTLLGRQIFDYQTRKQYYGRIQECMIDDVPIVPLYFRAALDVAKESVQNYRPLPWKGGRFWNAWEIEMK